MPANKTQALKALLEKVEAGELPRPLPFPAHQCAYIIGAFDGSLDAAKALHEAALPGWRWLIERDGNASVYPPDEDLREAVDVDGAVSPARAWLIAILRALIAQDGS